MANALEAASTLISRLRTTSGLTPDVLDILDLLLVHVDLLERKVAALEGDK